VATLANNTPAACAAHCAASQMFYAGVEYGSECHCGTGYATTGVQDANVWDCRMPCAGDGSQVCGAGWRIMLLELQQ
jgi:hypothetical protein